MCGEKTIQEAGQNKSFSESQKSHWDYL